ncbi:MAG TPA: lactate utilization protein C, partial [Azonexus sp.]|nr:lactate utilization protein C [Azonexus sp.]
TDNSIARAQILQRVSKGVGKADFAARRTVAEAALAAPVRGPQPVIDTPLVARFQAKAASLASTVERVGDPALAVAAVAQYLAAEVLGNVLVVTPDLRGFDWAGGGLTVRVGAAVDADKVGISGCFCAIAETGTLMLLSGPESPATVSLLPETHIALVPVGRIVATMEDAFALLRREHGSVPRAINFISGPSRTGDIEQTIVLGAHGPCRVHLVLMEATL